MLIGRENKTNYLVSSVENEFTDIRDAVQRPLGVVRVTSKISAIEGRRYPPTKEGAEGG